MSKLITTNDLQDILNEALPTPRYGGVQTASWTADSSAANNVKLTDSIHLTAGTYVITVKFPNTSATLLTAITYGTGTLLDSYCIGQGDAYSSHSYVINIPSEMDVYVVSATSTAIRYTYKESGGLRAIQIAESKVSSNEVDYIVEQGTETIWTYRKWNSGIVECWGTTVSASKAVTTKYGNAWYAPQDTIGFPVGLFNSIEGVQVELIDASGVGCWFEVKTMSVNAVTGYVYGIISNTSSFQYSVFARGRWK